MIGWRILRAKQSVNKGFLFESLLQRARTKRQTMKIKRLTILALLATLTCSALPVAADQHGHEPIPWQNLPADARSALAPMEERWDQLKPKQQHRLLRKIGDKKFKQGANRWEQLSPEQRQRIKDSRGRFKQLPEEERRALRQRWENMSEGERREATAARRALSHYPPKERQRLLKELRDLPPEERRAKLKKIKKAKAKNQKSKEPN
jgi:hypothetical protein